MPRIQHKNRDGNYEDRRTLYEEKNERTKREGGRGKGYFENIKVHHFTKDLLFIFEKYEMKHN